MITIHLEKVIIKYFVAILICLVNLIYYVFYKKLFILKELFGSNSTRNLV